MTGAAASLGVWMKQCQASSSAAALPLQWAASMQAWPMSAGCKDMLRWSHESDIELNLGAAGRRRTIHASEAQY